MIRYTTFKLKNHVLEVKPTTSPHLNTSDSLLNKNEIDVPYITDKFEVIKQQTVNHSRLSKEEYARKVLCEIYKSDYELISFKEKQLNSKILRNDFLPF